MAAFSGPRGATARGSSSARRRRSSTLIGSYAPQVAYYTQKYPSLAARGIPTRALALALTDTFAHVAVETFSKLADKYDVWLEAGVNMARDWKRIDGPGEGRRARRARPRLRLRGDDGGAGEHGAAVRPRRQARLQAGQGLPDADRAARPARPRARETRRTSTSVKTPVGRLGFVTSKDAWMPDVIGRLDDARAEILVQPEFFVGDVVTNDPASPWAPDTLKASGYSDLLRMPSLRAMALPSMTGDVYDIAADAQSHIAVRGGSAARSSVRIPRPGLTQVQPWPGADPGPAGRATITAQRPEGTLSQDVDRRRPTPKRRPVKRRRDRPVAPSAARAAPRRPLRPPGGLGRGTAAS